MPVADGTHRLVKICGLSTRAGVDAAVGAGADALGFIFAESRRQVTAETVREIAVQSRNREALRIGVFVNPTSRELTDATEQAGLSVVQLSGDEDPDILDQVDVPVWKVFRFGADVSLDAARAEIERWVDRPSPAARIMLDAAVAGVYGGSGHVANWPIAAQLSRHFDLILEGGLTPDNVAEAIATVGPAGVGTSSGVETGGSKDPERIAAFVRAAQAAFGVNQASSPSR